MFKYRGYLEIFVEAEAESEAEAEKKMAQIIAEMMQQEITGLSIWMVEE